MFSSDLVKLADFHLTACVLLAVSFVAGSAVGQPAKRLVIAWATVAGLVGLFVLTLIPGWSCWSLTDPVPAPIPDVIAPIVVAPAEPRVQPPIEAQPISAPPIDAGRPVVAVRQPAEPHGFDYSLFAALVVAWCVPAAYWIGVVVSATWLLIGWLFARRLVHRATEVDGAVVDLLRELTEQPPRLLVSDRVGGPVAIGLLRPTILLPRRLVDESDNAELRTVLAHELAHVRGRDLWLLAALRTLLVALWCNPLFWALRRRVRLDQETLADAAAAELSDRHGYAERLLGWARAMAPQPRLAGSAGLWESPSQLRRRIAVLLDEGYTVLRRSSLRWRAACGVACSALAVAASLVTLGAAEPAKLPANEAVAMEAPPDSAAPEQVEPTPAEETPKGGSVATRPPITGKVVYAESGEPAVGAEVRLLAWPEGAYRYDTKTTRAGPDGAFRFDDYPEGKPKLAAYLDGFSSRNKRYEGYLAEKGEEGVRLELREAPSLKVVVVEDATGRPVSDATVRLTWTDGERDHTTDTEGAVTIAGLTPETWTIEVQAAGYAEDEQAITLPAAGVTTVTSKLSPGAVVHGRVLSEEGTAIGEAGVSVFREGMRGGQIEYLKTGSDGRFRFDFLPEGRLLFMLSGDGLQDKREIVAARAGQEHELEVDFTLAKRPDGGSVAGVVIDASGEPIAGAEVLNDGLSSDDLRETVTDERGRFRLDDVFRGVQGHELVVKAEGHVAQAVTFNPGDAENPSELRVELKEGHRISGRVVDESGAPVNDTWVFYANGNRGGGMHLGGRATTGADGRFSFTTCPEDCPFTFQKDGYSSINERKLPLNRAEEVVVTLLDEGVIRGRVVDAVTGEPISPYTVHINFSPDRKPGDPSPTIQGNRATSLGERYANTDGAFVMADLVRDAPLQVSVEAEGYRRALKRRVEPDKKSEATEVVFEMTPLAAIELGRFAGKVVGPDGAPIEGVALRLIVADGELPRHNRFPFNWEMIQARGGIGLERSAAVTQFLSAVTDAEGSFAFESVEPGKRVQIAYWGEGVARGRVQGLERLSSEKQADLTISAAPGATVMGTVDKHAFPDLSNVLLMGPEGSLYSGYRAGDTGFEIRNVPAGKYELQAYRSVRDPENPQYYQTEVVKRVSVEVKSGDVVEVTVGAEQAVEESPDPPAGEVQEAGKATFLPIPPDYPTTMPGKPNTVAGLCLDESGDPLTGVEVLLLHRETISSAAEQVARTQTGADGRFRFSDVISDPESVKTRRMAPISELYQVVAKRAGYVSRSVAQDPSQIALHGVNIAFRLPPAGELSGRVTDAEGSAVEGARVSVAVSGGFDLGGQAAHAAFTDADGRYRISDLPRGDFAEQRRREAEWRGSQAGGSLFQGDLISFPSHVTVTHPGHAVSKQQLDRVPARLDIELAPAAVVEGRLVHEDGLPVEGLGVQIAPDPQSSRAKEVAPIVLTASIDSEGRYRLDSLPDGDYYLRVAGLYESDLVSLSGQKVRAEAGESTEAPDLVVSDGRVVEFQLVDAQTREPLTFDAPTTGVGWYFLSESDNAYGGSLTRETEIGADGRFSYRIDNRAVRMGIDLPMQVPGLFAEHPQFRVEVPAGQVEQPFPYPIDRSRIGKMNENPGAVLNDVQRLVAEGKVDEAIEKLSTLLDKQEQKDPNLLWKRGDFYGMAQQPAKAIADYEAALALKPGFAFVVKNNLAHLLATVEETAIRDPQRAVQLAREAIAEAPRPLAQLHDTLAAALEAAGDRQGANAALEQAVAVANDLEKPDLIEKLEKFRDR